MAEEYVIRYADGNMDLDNTMNLEQLCDTVYCMVDYAKKPYSLKECIVELKKINCDVFGID